MLWCLSTGYFELYVVYYLHYLGTFRRIADLKYALKPRVAINARYMVVSTAWEIRYWDTWKFPLIEEIRTFHNNFKHLILDGTRILTASYLDTHVILLH